MVFQFFLQQLQPNQFQISSDRGTPLVCNNHLSGLLSQILPPQNVSNTAASCETTLKTWAFYTKVSNYTEWIYQTIVRQQPIVAPGQTPPQPLVTSPPYYSSIHIFSEVQILIKFIVSAPPQINTQQPPQGEKPKANSANYIAKSLSTILVVSWLILNILV